MQVDSIAIMDAVVDVEETREPFGKRWGQEKFTLTSEHLDALRAGKLLAVDVHSEYVVFLELDRGCLESRYPLYSNR